MRLDFNILWVEDQPDQVQAQREGIDRRLRKEGFKVNAQFAPSVDVAKGYLSNDVYGDHVDLILMDFNLGEGPDGGDGVVMVREMFPYKDIVFYSASGTGTLQEVLEGKRLQGIFYSSREDLPDTVVGVFEELVRKVLDIEHSRGIIIGITSEIDHFVNRALVTAFSHADSRVKAEILAVVKEQIESYKKSLEKEIRAIEALTDQADLTSLADHHLVYTSAHRVRLLRKMLEAAGTHQEVCDPMLDYEKKKIPRRNDLAHASVERNGFSRKLLDRNGDEITVAVMRDLRVTLLGQHEVLEKLVESLRSQDEGKGLG